MKKHKLLLHICCGPCATVVIERLRESWEITGYFFNPNVHPTDEYDRRLHAVEIAAQRLGIPLIAGRYDPEEFYEAARGYENEPENGARCAACYRLRLEETVHAAVESGFDAIASTLTVGPRKQAAVIDSIGAEAARNASVGFVGGDWKKRDGYRRSCELSREFGIYRQRYCGCVFSMRHDT